MRRSLALAALALVAVACWLAVPDPTPERPAAPPVHAPEGPAPAPAPPSAPARADQLRKLKEAWQASRPPEQVGPDEQADSDDSEVWMDFFESVLEPAMSTGSPTGGSIEHLFASDEAKIEALWGHSCYDVAHGDPRHPAWQVFLRWTRGEADLAEVKAACARRLPR